MPRKSRKQPGSSGGAYPNRTDLSQPVRAPTGLAYGERQALVQAQQQAPLPQAAGVPGQAPDPAIAAAMQHDFQPVGLNAPTQRPHEPVTHGVPVGPGGGPEVLARPATTTDQLRKLALATGDSGIQELANRMQQYGI